MQIKRLLVEEKEYVMGEIESFLCRMGISYVKVENEIHCPNLILRFYEFNEIRPVIWNLLMDMSREEISDNILDSLLVIGEEVPFGVGGHNRDFLLEAFTRPKRALPQIEDFISVSPKRATPSPYPQPTNKRKQLQMENKKYMKKLK